MTIRAVVIGLIMAVVIGAVGFFNDLVMHQTFLFGSYMPIFIYGLAILFVVTLNPLLARISNGASLSGGELALIIAMMLPASYVSGRTFNHHFTPCLMTPRHYAITNPGWQKRDLIRRAPSIMLAGVQPEVVEEDVLEPRELCTLMARPPEEAGSVAEKQVLTALGPGPRERLRSALGGDDDDCRSAVARAINSILPTEGLFAASQFKGVVLPKEAEHIMKTGVMNDEEQRRINRYLVDVVYAKRVKSLIDKEDFVRSSFMQGMGVGTESISWSDVPWYAWTRTLTRFWIPLVIVFGLMFIGLALIAHRQFSDHEHLPYPIVTFAKSLLPEEGNIISSVLRSRLFWVAAGLVALLHVNNYAQKYYPDYLVWFPTWFDFRSLGELVPVLRRGGDHGILHFNIYFTCIGFAYFIASDVALSVALAPLAYSLVAGTLAGYGVSLHTAGRNAVSPDGFIKMGAFFGMFLIIVYSGRFHYLSVFKRCFGLRAQNEVRDSEIWGARVFLASGLIAVLLLWWVGVSLLWSVLFWAGVVMVYVATSRVVAETGSFLLQPHVYPAVMIWGFVGARVLGPTQLMILMMVGAIFNIGTHVQVMPMTMHSLKLVEKKPLRTASLGATALIVALLVCIPVTLYFQYDIGSGAASDGWTRWVPRYPYDPIVSVEDKLEAQGMLEEAGNYSGLDWIRAINPNWPAVAAFTIALVLVLGTEFVRLRWAGWPLHPVLFLFAGWWHSRMLAVSFLIGWLVKVIVNKYGGAPTYRKLKPLMMGLIAGDMLGGIIITIIGTIYYFWVGAPPKGHWVLPG